MSNKYTQKYVTRHLRVTAVQFSKGLTIPAFPELHLMPDDVVPTRCLGCGELLSDHGVVEDFTKILFVCPGDMVVRVDEEDLHMMGSNSVFNISKFVFDQLFKEDTTVI